MRDQKSDPCFISHDSFILKGFVTRENHRIMATLEALVITALLTLGSIGVSGNTGQLSTTTGDTVFIPCDFGEGTIRNLYWYYNDGTGPVKILTLFEENVSIDDAYANRASLHGDSSTLILTDIGVKDEGTYRCDVDREAQTAVPNINTNLYVFSLTSRNLPEIAQCTEVAGKSSTCNFYTNKSITMNCALSRVYPAEDAELIWYQEEQRVHSTDSSKENDDGTVDITAEIEVSESGHLTCNATFVTAQGAESTAVTVGVWITHVPGAPNTPEKGLSKGGIAGIAVVSVVIAVACLVIIIIILRKRRGSATPINKSCSGSGEEAGIVEDHKESMPLIEGNSSRNGEGRASATGNYQVVSEEQLELLSNNFPDAKYAKLSIVLGFSFNTSKAVLIKHGNDYHKAVLELLMAWKTEHGGRRSDLITALKASDAGGLVGKISETVISAEARKKESSLIQGPKKLDEVDSPSQNGSPENNQGPSEADNSASSPLLQKDEVDSPSQNGSVENNKATSSTAATTSTTTSTSLPKTEATTSADAASTTPSTSSPKEGFNSVPTTTTNVPTTKTTTAATTPITTPTSTSALTPQAASNSTATTVNVSSSSPLTTGSSSAPTTTAATAPTSTATTSTTAISTSTASTKSTSSRPGSTSAPTSSDIPSTTPPQAGAAGQTSHHSEETPVSDITGEAVIARGQTDRKESET